MGHLSPPNAPPWLHRDYLQGTGRPEVTQMDQQIYRGSTKTMDNSLNNKRTRCIHKDRQALPDPLAIVTAPGPLFWMNSANTA